MSGSVRLRTWGVWIVAGLLMVVVGILWVLRKKNDRTGKIVVPSDVVNDAREKQEEILTTAAVNVAKARSEEAVVIREIQVIKAEPDQKVRLQRLAALMKKR